MVKVRMASGCWCTRTGKDDLEEAYAFRFENDKVVADAVRKA
jgi:hypothetical protein